MNTSKKKVSKQSRAKASSQVKAKKPSAKEAAAIEARRRDLLAAARHYELLAMSGCVGIGVGVFLGLVFIAFQLVSR